MTTTTALLWTLAVIAPAASYAVCWCLSEICGLVREMRK